MRKKNEIDEEDEEENLSPFKLAEEVKESKKISNFSIEEVQKNNLEKQIKFLKKSNQNIVTLIKGKTELSSNPFFQYRLEKNSINLFLISIYKKIKINDIISLTNNLISNNELLLKKISELKQNQSTLEKEINWVAQEKIITGDFCNGLQKGSLLGLPRMVQITQINNRMNKKMIENSWKYQKEKKPKPKKPSKLMQLIINQFYSEENKK